jgi:hypothetical protein
VNNGFVRRPSEGRTLRATVVVLCVTGLGTLLACARESVTLGAGETGNGIFAPLDAGDASAADTDASGGQCVATACPAPWATCPAYDGTLPLYACATNVDTDLEHCGSCGMPCRPASGAYNVHMACASGKCQAFCNERFSDCNNIPDDGCESATDEDPANCGACGVKCAPGVPCVGGQCGCPPGMTFCGDKCVDLRSNNGNCGACGRACIDHQPADAGVVPPHMTYACEEGECTALRCVHTGDEFWEDCNNDKTTDGCEVELRSDSANCGKCGNACAPGQRCLGLSGIVECQCKPGQTMCPTRSGTVDCIDTETDPRNCGACGYICPPVPNAAAVCEHGRCRSACLPGMADCNGRDDDGCEVDLNKDPRNCGACGAMCDVARGQPCIGGWCLTGDCSEPEAK